MISSRVCLSRDWELPSTTLPDDLELSCINLHAFVLASAEGCALIG